jgi:putative DNA primase/helicase
MLLPPPPPQPFNVNPPNDPPGNAVLLLDRLFKVDGRWTLIHHRGDFLLHIGTHYRRIPDAELEQVVSWYFENAVYLKQPGGNPPPPPVPTKFPVTNDQLGNLMRALRNKVIISEEVNVSTWIERRDGDPEPADLVPMANGLLNTVTRELVPSTPRFLNRYALDFAYDPGAAQPGVLHAWLRSMFADDADRLRLTQEMMGYLITPRMDQHKMFVLTGPPRSGKGTMARLLEQLVGEDNYGATSLAMLGDSFGLENIADKPVVVLGDAFDVGRNGGLALERLLGIIGQDSMVVNPKGRRTYSAKLPCRFMLLSNDLPALPDKAQALRERWLHLRFQKSFAGHEDRELDRKLAAELPGIFLWALDGLDRLRMRGQFVQPETGRDDLDMLTAIVSPETVFVAECLLTAEDADLRDVKADLFLAWQNWCRENGVSDRKAGSREMFVKALKRVSACSHIRPGKMPRDEHGKQANALLGVQLTDAARAKYVMSEADFDLGQMGIPSSYTDGFRRNL